MSLEEDLATYLKAEVTDQVYPVLLKTQTQFPALDYTLSDAGQVGHMTGRSSLASATFRVRTWGRTPTDARTLAGQVKDKLDRFRGMMGETTIRGIFFEETGQDTIAEKASNDKDRIYGRIYDYKVWYRTTS